MKSLVALAFAAAIPAAGRLTEGAADAKVRILVYEDLECSDCAKFRPMMDQKLLAKYGSKVAFEHRDFPLTKHAWSRLAAVAARHFERENPKLAVEFRRVTMEKQASITADRLGTHVATFARQFGSDPVKAVEAMTDAALQKLVDDDFAEGLARGVTRTPTVFVDGEPFVETFAFDEIAKSIEAALAATESGK
jgi:protein-disulfide isomerase